MRYPSTPLYREMLLGPLVALCLQSIAATSHASDFNVQLGTLKDTRSTDHSAGLMIELKIDGDETMHVETMSADVASAISGDGVSLLQHSPRTNTEVVKAINRRNPAENHLFIRLRLDSPVRTEQSVARLTGTLHFLIPILDEASTLTVNDLGENGGKALDSPVLENAKASVLISLKEQYDKERLHDVTPSPTPLSADQKIFESRMPMLATKMSLPSTIDDKTIAVEVSDPNHVIGGIEFLRKDNSKTVSKWSGTWEHGKRIISTYAFPDDHPADVSVRLFLKTSKSWIAQPFHLENIPLP